MDCMRKIKNEKGSMYIYSILIVFVLTILGVSLMGVVMSNMRMGIITTERNKAFYMADGAIEEALWELHADVVNAEREAEQWVNGDYRDSDGWKDFIAAVYEDEDITAKEAREIIEGKLEAEFKKEYFALLTADGKLAPDIVGRISNVDFTLNSEDVKESSTGDIAVESEYVKGERIEVKLTSSAAYNKLGKNAELKLNIVSPGLVKKVEDEEEIAVETKIFKTNDIYLRAITCEGDIVAVGDGKVEVEGDVYAYGTYPEEVRVSNKETGGIVSGYSSEDGDFIAKNKYLGKDVKNDFPQGKGNLSIAGTAATKANIQTRHSGSKLNVKKLEKEKIIIEYDEDENDYVVRKPDSSEGKIVTPGNAYCNSVILAKNASNSSIDIGGNVVMYDDMELNGFNGSIIVGSDGNPLEGEIWALLDGDPAGNEADSGYGERSGSIIINSNGSSDRIEANRIFLAGTSYMNSIKDSQNKLYQTGESLAMSKYSYFYQGEYSGEQNVTYKEYTDAEGNGYMFVDLGPDKKVEHYLEFANENYSSISKEDRNKAQIGELEGSPGSENYSLGAVMANEKIYDPTGTSSSGNISDGNFIDSGRFAEISAQKVSEIDQNTSLLGKRNYATNRNINEIFDQMYKSDVSKEETDIPSNIKVFTQKDVYVNGSIWDGEGLRISGKDLKGIIFTTGNVFICGETTFKGAIVAKGNVMFFGDGNKKVTYDEGRVIDMVSDDEELYGVFYGETGRKFEVLSGKTSSNDLGLGVEEEGTEKRVIANHGAISMKSAFDDVMEFVSWKETD